MKQLKAIAAVVSGIVLAGCVATTPNSDAKFGRAATLTRAQQTLNPDVCRPSSDV